MRSLRARLLASLTLAVLVSTVLTVGLAAVLVRHQVAGQALGNLQRQADASAGTLDAGGRLSARRRAVRVLAARHGRLRAAPRLRAILPLLPASGNASGDVRLDDRRLLYAARDTAQGRIVLVRPARLAAADWRPFLVSLLIAGAVGAALAALLALGIARRLAGPVRRLSEATKAVAAGESGARVPVEGHDELAELSASFNAMADELAAAREAERTFLLSVSHELKTPLTAVRGYAEGLVDGAVDPAQAGAVIGAEAERLQRLVGDLLELGRLERREFAVVLGSVDLGDVARRAVERFALRARELEVALEVDVAPDANASGDAERLLQAVSNLVENALRVTPAGGRVDVRARAGELVVADTGPGLAPEDLPRAFERFRLHDRYGRDRRDGSGLGLAIVRELVTAMGGTVAVDSAPGRGAAFTVRLPSTPVA